MIGMLAKSKAGHDKDSIYLIVGEEAEFVYLADGRLKTLESPKKKNKRHIQIIKQEIHPLPLTDTEVKRIIKGYRKEEQIS